MKQEAMQWLDAITSGGVPVEWDRVTDDDEAIKVYGWILRPDGKRDFVLVRFDEDTIEFTTSSAKHSAEIGRLLCYEKGEHHPCIPQGHQGHARSQGGLTIMLTRENDVVCKACHMAPACNTGQCAALKALRGVRQVMAFSSRDWSVDPELWAIHRAAHGEDPTFTMLGRDARNESGIPTGAFVAPAQPRCQHLHGEGFVMCDQNRPEVMSRRTCDPSACTGYQAAARPSPIAKPMPSRPFHRKGR